MVNAAPCEITNVMVARVLLKCFGWLLVGQHDMSHAIFNARLVPKAGPVISGNFHHVISHGVAFTTSVVKNIDISINIDTEISERYQY